MRLLVLLCVANAKRLWHSPDKMPSTEEARKWYFDNQRLILRSFRNDNSTIAPLMRSKRLLLAPHNRLLMCWLPKVASRTFVALFEAMTGCTQHPLVDCMPCSSAHSSRRRQCCTKQGSELVCQHAPQLLNQSDCGAERLYQCQGLPLQVAMHQRRFRRLLFVRDPEHRFISAYLDKYRYGLREHPRRVRGHVLVHPFWRRAPRPPPSDPIADARAPNNNAADASVYPPPVRTPSARRRRRTNSTRFITP